MQDLKFKNDKIDHIINRTCEGNLIAKFSNIGKDSNFTWNNID